ncbi:uncharacterized protein LOC126657740 isoform X2 [Mercurialis annua]|uniref:uncharacterized protein LOC126657740 isoform X2 n=1 Tax=Mercurialis annua TaxID=3986 RepID=UPI002160E822|nr:uncharacterized protein LOC126657740 isoform X2 [Mercurialis annua]
MDEVNFQVLESKSGPDRLRRTMAPVYLKAKDLVKCTNGFSEDNLIGKFQFGEVYRGFNFRKEEVIVKDEIRLHECFRSHNFHPNLAKPFAFCIDDHLLAAVYHLQPPAIDTLLNLIEQDSFTWPQRIKVALGFASLLQFMHSESQSPTRLPYLIRNINAAHIMVDEDHEAVLFDLSMISGGILIDKRNLPDQYVNGCHGYIDPAGAYPGKWSDKCDVFSFGVLILSLISKRVCKDIRDSSPVYEWAREEYKSKSSSINFGKSQSSLVHQSLESGPEFYFSDAITITKLAMRCVQHDPQKRPKMKKVVGCLRNLNVTRHYADNWEINKILNGDVGILQHDSHSGKKSKQHLKWHQKRILRFFPAGLIASSSFKDFNHSWKEKESVRLTKRLHGYFFQITLDKCHLFSDLRGSNHSLMGGSSVEGKDNALKVFSYENLRVFTNKFSEQNRIGNVQYGEVFRGKIDDKNVMVKIWKVNTELYLAGWFHNKDRLWDEMALLQDPKLISHPNLVKLIGYCYEEDGFGVVYDLDPHDTVRRLVPREDGFTWLQRIKVGYEFASLLKFLHAPNPPYEPCRVRSIDASHIVLDKEYSPKLFEFGICSGGIILDDRYKRNKYACGSGEYIDPHPYTAYYGGSLATRSDVYAYGCILLSLISKQISTFEEIRNGTLCISEWAVEAYESQRSKKGSVSLVHESLKNDDGFNENDGVALTKLALQCVDMEGCKRPAMKQVAKRLRKLHAVGNHAKDLGIKHKYHYVEI